MVVSIFAIRQVLAARLEQQVDRRLVQEVEKFRLLASERTNILAQSEKATEALFDAFLASNIPSNGVFLITLLDGKIYASSPTALPKALQENISLLKSWSAVKEPQRGRLITPADTVLYLTEPVQFQGKTQGVFVVVQSTAGEWQEVNEAVTVVIQVTLIALAIAAILTWVVAGRVLVPLRLLTETARSISASDLTQRLPIQGADEIAELTVTFNEMLNRLDAAFASQRNFINDAGHELRTPITIIRGHLELMGDDPAERGETLALVTDELDRMNRMVNDLLLLAKAQQPNFLQLQTVEIGLLTEELYTKAIALGDRDWQLEAKATGSMITDRQRLTQAMMNLAENATQHTKPGDAIALGSSMGEGVVKFWVRDAGTGIAAADRDRIFERFARAANRRRRSEGAGLGLAIVRAIAQAHGGQVELETQLGFGSTFTLILPLETELLES